MLGTTQCTNAIVERKHLAPIGVLRLGRPRHGGHPPHGGLGGGSEKDRRKDRRHWRRL